MQPSISSFDMVIFTEHTTTGAGPGPIHDPCCSYAAPILTPTNIIVKMFRIIQIENVLNEGSGSEVCHVCTDAELVMCVKRLL